MHLPLPLFLTSQDPTSAALPHSRPATLPLPRPGTLPLYFSGHSPGVVVQQAFPSPSSPSVITQAPSSNRHLTPLPGHVPLLFHLPNGQTMPLGTVTSPTMPIPTALPLPFSTIPSPVAMIPSPVGMIPHIPGIPGPHMFSALPSQLPSPSEPKMRLKMILSEHQDSRSAEEGSSQHEKAIKEERPQMEHRPWEKSSHDICMKDVRMPGQALGIGGSGLTRRRRCAIEDPEERRRRFLERNRAAATRCRLKRKAWVFSLEKKAEELTETNTQLQSEVTMLRREVAHLKQLLLAHKDCPVTAMQKKQAYGGCDEIGRNTAIATRLSSKPAALLGPLHEEPGPSEAMRAALLLSSHEMRASESRDASLGKAGQSPVIIMPTKPLPVSQ
uniref:Activating transcription factor 2 n=2 Tax=Eptatretus burgeri TaxID=7764 RepID=A0A8C4QSS4_EPTBU